MCKNKYFRINTKTEQLKYIMDKLKLECPLAKFIIHELQCEVWKEKNQYVGIEKYVRIFSYIKEDKKIWMQIRNLEGEQAYEVKLVKENEKKDLRKIKYGKENKVLNIVKSYFERYDVKYKNTEEQMKLF